MGCLFDKHAAAVPQHSTQMRALTMDQANSQAEHHHAEQGAHGRDEKAHIVVSLINPQQRCRSTAHVYWRSTCIKRTHKPNTTMPSKAPMAAMKRLTSLSL
mmetsp:Transcript_75567/g.212870  ORF Transcript_75567/g.212870 Transcript_75567/m.212870 type:complete len:101 (+) Transcript_75567:111-413(+)